MKGPAFPRHRSSAPHNPVPTGHRWLLAIGVACLLLWGGASALAQETITHEPQFASIAEQTATLFRILTTAFLSVGVCCEVILVWIISSRLEQYEQDLLADLSGRSNRSCTRKKSKLIITDELPEDLTPEELELAGYRKVLLKRVKTSSDAW